MPQLGGTQRDNAARWGLQLDVGRPGARDGTVEPQPQSSQAPEYVVDPVAPGQSCEFGDGMVHLRGDAMPAGDFPKHPGGLGAHRGRALVDERAHEGHCHLRVPCGQCVSSKLQSSCRLSRAASKAYHSLSFRTWTVMCSRWRAVSEASAMKGTTYCVTPSRIARMTSCATFGGARVLRHQW